MHPQHDSSPDVQSPSSPPSPLVWLADPYQIASLEKGKVLYRRVARPNPEILWGVGCQMWSHYIFAQVYSIASLH